MRAPGESYPELLSTCTEIRALNAELHQELDALNAQHKLEAAATRELIEKLQSRIAQQELPPQEQSVAEILQQAVITLIDQKNASEVPRVTAG